MDQALWAHILTGLLCWGHLCYPQVNSHVYCATKYSLLDNEVCMYYCGCSYVKIIPRQCYVGPQRWRMIWDDIWPPYTRFGGRNTAEIAVFPHGSRERCLPCCFGPMEPIYTHNLTQLSDSIDPKPIYTVIVSASTHTSPITKHPNPCWKYYWKISYRTL